MGVKYEIIPGRSDSVTLGDIEKISGILLYPSKLVGEVEQKIIRSIEISSYKFFVVPGSELLVWVGYNDGVDDEFDTLSGWESDLDTNTLVGIAHDWKMAGYSIDVSCSNDEQSSRMLINLTSAIASALDGFVLVDIEGVCALPPGLWSAIKFSTAHGFMR